MQPNICCDPTVQYTHDITSQTPTSLYVPYVEIDRSLPRTAINAQMPPPPAPEKAAAAPVPEEQPEAEVAPVPAPLEANPKDVESIHSTQDIKDSSPLGAGVLDSGYHPAEYVEMKKLAESKNQGGVGLSCCQGAEAESEYEYPSGGPSLHSRPDERMAGNSLCGWGSAQKDRENYHEGLHYDSSRPNRPVREGSAKSEAVQGGGVFDLCRGGTTRGSAADDELIMQNGVIRGVGHKGVWRDPEHLPSSTDHVPYDNSQYLRESQIVKGPGNTTWHHEVRPGNSFQQGSIPMPGPSDPPPPFSEAPDQVFEPSFPPPNSNIVSKPKYSGALDRNPQEPQFMRPEDDRMVDMEEFRSTPEDSRGKPGPSSWAEAVEDERNIPRRSSERQPAFEPYGQSPQTVNRGDSVSWMDRAQHEDMPSYGNPMAADKGLASTQGVIPVTHEEIVDTRDQESASVFSEKPQKKTFNLCCSTPTSDNGDTYVLQIKDGVDTFEGFTPETIQPRPIPVSTLLPDSPRDSKHQKAIQKAAEASHALTKNTSTLSNSQTIRSDKWFGRLDKQSFEERVLRPAEEAVRLGRTWESERYNLIHPHHEPLYVRFYVKEDRQLRNHLEGPPGGSKWMKDSNFDLQIIFVPAFESRQDPMWYSDTYATLPGDSKVMVRESEGFVVRPSELRRQEPQHIYMSATQISASCCAASSLRADMERLYRSSDYEKSPTPISDCTVVCEKEIFPANRSLLVARSRVFAEMLASKSRAVIAVSGAPPEVVRSLVDFVHTDRCALLDITRDIKASIRLFETAMRFGVMSLANELAVRLGGGLKEDNIERVGQAATKTRHAYLIQAVTAYRGD